MPKSAYLASALIKAALKATGFTGPATVYLSLHTADPTSTGTVGEVSGNSYVRYAITFGTEANGSVSNSNTITTAAPSPGAWGTLTHWALWDAQTSGNCLYRGPLNAQVATSIGVPVQFDPSTVTLTET